MKDLLSEAKKIGPAVFRATCVRVALHNGKVRYARLILVDSLKKFPGEPRLLLIASELRVHT